MANPVSLIIEIAARFTSPFVHFKTWLITTLLTCLFSLLYFALKKMQGSFGGAAKMNSNYTTTHK